MSEVIWLPHPLYPCYEVSNDGRVRSLGRYIRSKNGSSAWHEGRVLRTYPRSRGYLGSTISIDCRRTNFEVHVWVCEAFHGLRPMPDLEVRHLNGNKLDNRPDNLRWGTASENMADLKRHGTNPMWTKTHCKYGHEFTPENTMNSAHRTRPGRRECRTCYRTRTVAKAKRDRETRAALKDWISP